MHKRGGLRAVPVPRLRAGPAAGGRGLRGAVLFAPELPAGTAPEAPAAEPRGAAEENAVCRAVEVRLRRLDRTLRRGARGVFFLRCRRRGRRCWWVPAGAGGCARVHGVLSAREPAHRYIRGAGGMIDLARLRPFSSSLSGLLLHNTQLRQSLQSVASLSRHHAPPRPAGRRSCTQAAP